MRTNDITPPVGQRAAANNGGEAPVRQAFQNHRPEATQQMQWQTMANNSPVVQAQMQQAHTIQKNDAGTVAQFGLPHGEKPQTKGYYNAQNNAMDKVYKSGRPSKFSNKFKISMIQNEWNGSYNGDTNMWHIFTSGGSQVVLPRNAIQIDHKVPWKTIESRLKKNPENYMSKKQLRKFYDEGILTKKHGHYKYSVYGARMYYHDVANLQPMAGSDNASKGSSNTSDGNTIPDKLKARMARSGSLHHAMLQAGIEAYNYWIEEDGTDESTNIANILDNVDSKLVDAESDLDKL